LISKELVLDILKTVDDPELNQDIVSLNMVKDIEIKEEIVHVTIALTTPACPLREKIRSDVEQALLKKLKIKKVEITFANMEGSNAQFAGKIPLPIKHLIAVGSGKGGVGKSTVAANLAISLAQKGFKVGLMDADIYGPNIPTMMGVQNLPPQNDGKITPAEAYGVKVISIGMFIQKGQPLVWRGPVLHSAVRQLLADVDWGLLDYLIVDLPPGTGDVQISLMQIASVAGSVIVTLPQKVSTDDAYRAAEMFRAMNVPILGIVENMGLMTLPDGSTYDLFGDGGGKKLAEELHADFFGSIPIDRDIRIGGDSGFPVTVTNPSASSSKVFQTIAAQLQSKLECKN
jgi:ATP-binding protein involved in chromosome partitioning